MVAGTRNIKSKEQASLILSEKIKRAVPEMSSAIDTNIIIVESGSGNPLLIKYSA